MAAGVYNLTIEQGASWQLTLSIDSTAGTDLDIDGYTFSGKMAKSYYDENPVTMSYNIADGDSGQVVFSLTSSQTENLDSSIEYVYDIDMTDTSDFTTRLLQGRATISPGLA